ncbi:hypothetical protein Y1Q_0009612 [Alligator mississippiensis]|uniref:Uncharacterized protein n=1 Tax=Alligator mississippiensis TaxID=8496 RepID=A0A151NUY5_ALLMI|nr:hypothetical protein Y1Q_0009612 [Alligator mississippiensis]
MEPTRCICSNVVRTTVFSFESISEGLAESQKDLERIQRYLNIHKTLDESERKSLITSSGLAPIDFKRIGYDDQQSHLAAEAFSYSSAIKVQKAGSKILHHALS